MRDMIDPAISAQPSIGRQYPVNFRDNFLLIGSPHMRQRNVVERFDEIETGFQSGAVEPKNSECRIVWNDLTWTDGVNEFRGEADTYHTERALAAI